MSETPLAGASIDTGESKQVEERLHESEFKFRMLYESMLDAYVSVAMDGRIIEFNHAYQELTGYSADELLSKTYVDLTPEQWHGLEARIVTEQILPRGYSEIYEKEYRRKDGTLVQIELRTILLRDATGQPELMWALIRDISERKQAETALLEAKQAAEQANRAKNDFLANMSHEIRTPINGIMGMVQLLDYTELSTEQKDYLAAILSSAESLLAVVNDVLDLAKIEAGKLELELGEFSLRGNVSDVVRNQLPPAHAKGLSLKAVIPADLPDNFTGDQLRLKQVLLNLLGNAVKFTAAGQVTLTVTMEERQDDTALLRFDVADSGIGISPDAIGRIFAPFSQADASMARQFGGTGLGLAICLQLLELMGGSIGVDSREGVGSTFHVRVPLEINVPRTEPDPLRADLQPPLWEGLPLRVLLVEDNAVSRMFFLEVLGKYGHRVDIAVNGVEALERWRQADYDLILMDVQMPVMAGSEAVRKLREEEKTGGRHVPVIALTAHAMEEMRLDFLRSGFDGYVSKPTRIRTLLGEMKRCLGPE